MASQPITMRLCYPVPLLWRDSATGRERLGSDVAELAFALRRVDPVDLRGVEGSTRDDVSFEGQTWRAIMRAGAGFCSLDQFARLLEAPDRFLGLGLPKALTTAAGLQPEAVAQVPARVRRGIIERLDAEAARWARRFAEGELLYDGRAVRIAATPRKGVPLDLAGEPGRHLDIVGPCAVGLLERSTGLAARDPEVERAAAPLRRVALRGMVHAIPREDLEGAAQAVTAYAALMASRAPTSEARRYAWGTLNTLRTQVLPGLEHVPPPCDVEDLGRLAP